MSTSELASTYAALILHDDGISFTAEKLATLVKAAGLTVESYWPNLFAKLSSKRNIDDLILNVGSSATLASGCAPVPMASPAPADAAAVTAATTTEEKEEVHEESEEDMVFGLFD